MAIIPSFSNRTREPAPSITRHPAAIKSDPISSHASDDGAEGAKTAASVFRWRAFIQKYKNNAFQLQSKKMMQLKLCHRTAAHELKGNRVNQGLERCVNNIATDADGGPTLAGFVCRFHQNTRDGI